MFTVNPSVRQSFGRFLNVRNEWIDPRPHPGPLPRGEGEMVSVSLENDPLGWPDVHSRNRNHPMAVSSPGGEGQGEGGLISQFYPETI